MPYDVVAFETDETARLFTCAEEGAFHRLLRHSWVNGSIPDNMTACAALCRISEAEFSPMWPTIQRVFLIDRKHPERRINAKQELERKYVNERRAKQVEAGRLSGLARRRVKTTRRKSLPVQRQVVEQPLNKRSTNVEQTLNLPSHPIPSQPIPTLPLIQRSSVLQSVEEGNERTNGHEPAEAEFQKFWGPVEGFLRQQVVDESFQTYYAGTTVLGMTSQFVTLAVPPALIERDHDPETTAKRLAHTIEIAGTGFLRGRSLRVVPLKANGAAP